MKLIKKGLKQFKQFKPPKELQNELAAQLSQACKDGDPMSAVIAKFNGQLDNLPECKQQ